MSICEQPVSRVRARRANEADLPMAMHGISGIFWVLERLVVDEAFDDSADPTELKNGIADQIVAGGILTKLLTDRFRPAGKPRRVST